MVLDDRDNRKLSAMFGFFWDLNQASGSGETMPDPQGALAALLREDDATLWDKVSSAFRRRQKPVDSVAVVDAVGKRVPSSSTTSG